MNILYVCGSNLIRSWAAEILTREIIPQAKAASCGVRETAKRNLRRDFSTRLLLELEDNQSRTTFASQKLIDWSSVIIYMSPEYQKILTGSFYVKRGKPQKVWSIPLPSAEAGSLKSRIEEIKKDLTIFRESMLS